jgi:hypothetical protein
MGVTDRLKASSAYCCFTHVGLQIPLSLSTSHAIGLAACSEVLLKWMGSVFFLFNFLTSVLTLGRNWCEVRTTLLKKGGDTPEVGGIIGYGIVWSFVRDEGALS